MGAARVFFTIALNVLIVGMAVVGPLVVSYYYSDNLLYFPWYNETARPNEKLNEEFGMHNWYTFRSNPKDEFLLQYYDVEFVAPNNTKLRGWYIPAKNARDLVFIGVHSEGVDRREFLKMVPNLYAESIAFFFFDSREHGISSGNRSGPSFGVREYLDISYAVKYVKERFKFNRCVVFGIGQGANAAIKAAALDKNITAVIAESPSVSVEALFTHTAYSMIYNGYTYFMQKTPWMEWLLPLSQFIPYSLYQIPAKIAVSKLKEVTREEDWFEPIDAIKNVTQPILFVHGKKDPFAYWTDSEKLFEACPSPDKEIWIIEDGVHGEAFNANPTTWVGKISEFARTVVQKTKKK